MTKQNQLTRLQQISQLVLDIKLLALTQAAAKRQQSLDLLTSLNEPLVETDLNAVAGHRAAIQYQHWADTKRGEINVLLARQTVEMILARNDAGQAFSKNQALRGLQGKIR